MRRLRRAKIVATLGPASSDAAMIDKLFKAGADVFRINMSHTSPERMRELVGMIRGAPGSLVQLQIVPANAAPGSLPLTVPIIRDQIRHKQ